VAGSGIPGVGVTPGLSGLPATFESGIPDVDVVTFGAEFAGGAGTFDAELLTGASGLAERPGGRSLALTFCVLTLAALALAVVEFVFATGAAPQPTEISRIPKIAKDIKNFINFSIKYGSSGLSY
jgi:hypothetical protein